MKFKYIVIVLSLSGLCLLYVLSLFSQSTTIPLSQVPFNEGKQVTVTGIVTMYQPTKYGSQLISLREVNTTNSSEFTLYLEGQVSVEYGDMIEATGVVQRYNNNWEITISDPRDIVIQERWDRRSFPVWQLAKNPVQYVDTNVNVTGTIVAVSSTGFSLRDTEGTTLVQVSCDHKLNSSVSQGTLVVVKARFLYNEETLSYFLKVTDSTQGIQVVGVESDA
jgi:DNA/RNA endonuclease YhcR with UshA esterase domain